MMVAGNQYVQAMFQLIYGDLAVGKNRVIYNSGWFGGSGEGSHGYPAFPYVSHYRDGEPVAATIRVSRSHDRPNHKFNEIINNYDLIDNK